MKTRSLLSLAFVALAFAASSQVVPARSAHTAGAGVAVNKAVLLQLVNTIRKKGCQCGNAWYAPAPPLAWNDQLEKAAAEHSLDMLQNNYFSHTGPNGAGAGVRIQEAGYRWRDYGENIAAGYQTEQEVIAGWLKSPGHCKNIMNRNYQEMGVGRAGNYWTQAFGKK